MKKWLTAKPLSTGAAAVYPWSEKLAKQFTAVSRFDEPFALWRKFGSGKSKMIALPRRMCPMSDNDCRATGIPVDFTSTFFPRDAEQDRVTTDCAKLLKAGESHILQAPTGFGKTWCAMDVIAQVGLQTLIVVTKEDVRDQWYAAAKTVLGLKGTDVGMIQADQCHVVGRKLVIAMIQSVSQFGRYPASTFASFGLVVWDEVHRVGADHFSNTCWIIPAKLRWGLSATPTRKDGKELMLQAHIGDVRVLTHNLPMTPKVLQVHTTVQFPQLKCTPGRMGHVTKIIAKDLRRNHFIARFVKKAWERKRHTIVFSDSLAHLDWLHAALLKVGVASGDIAFYVGGLSKRDRETAKTKAILLATYAYTSEATDIPSLDTMVMATPRADVVQIVGRVLREHPNKPTPLVLDLIDPLRLLVSYAKKRTVWYSEIGANVQELIYG